MGQCGGLQRRAVDIADLDREIAQNAFAIEKAGFLGTGRTITQELHRGTPFRKRGRGAQAVTLARNFVSRSK